tara:strand:- start:1310 stop:1912 length:603 start_codon:yes stop_codon:yes gene_type:complete
MDLKKAANRFQYRFSKNEQGEFRNFKPNKDDIEAINCILTWINNQKKDVIAKNNLFAKLLVYQYTQNIRHYGTTVLSDLNFAQRDLCKILDYPLEGLYKAFYNDLHNNQLNQLNKNLDINVAIDNKIDRIRKGDLEIDNFLLDKYNGLENYIKNLESEKITDEQQINVIKSLSDNKKTFTFDFVTDKLNDMVTEAYNKFN